MVVVQILHSAFVQGVVRVGYSPSLLLLWILNNIKQLWSDLQKPNITMHFGNPDFCITEFYIPKALFCSNTNAVLQILFELQG